ncbi:MAG: response regulator transcription factor [Clostridia bacterium]|nr:response regulator transcription factor [Clostridia bacterium]
MERKKILIVDDEVRMRKIVSDFLVREGYQIFEAGDGEEALIQFAEQQPDLLILDVMMPRMDGWQVCREIRKQSNVPIIMVTARSEEIDELTGFDLGADEYIAKPFSPRILVARVNALLRRAFGNAEESRSYGMVRVNRAAREVQVQGRKVELTYKEFELLCYMMDNAGMALTRGQILNHVWNYDYYGDERTVDTHVKTLRNKLGNAADYIRTVRGIGYKFEQ